MIQLWLQWYFPEFWAANLEFPEGVAHARILAEAPLTDHSTFACFYFFRGSRTRTDLEWGRPPLEDTPGSLIKPFKMLSEKTLPLSTERNLLVVFSRGI